ncbi:hypothetical protein [Pedobacter gandavensis]|uniref:hypothetical protein n=1 Tax=Pedobacter gandavensis TaxID=2679963 RepID=UPI00292FB807|nr:hypothetical protein [Pedobacter gandavensis]
MGNKNTKREKRKIAFQASALLIGIFFILPILIFAIFSAGYLIASSKNGEYLKVTNIGFALFAGIATLMFNWARSLNAQNFNFEINRINEIGEHAIIGGIGYLIASLFQFIQTIPHNTGILVLLPNFYFSITPIIIIVTFMATSFSALYIICEITTIYFEVLHVRKKIEGQAQV